MLNGTYKSISHFIIANGINCINYCRICNSCPDDIGSSHFLCILSNEINCKFKITRLTFTLCYNIKTVVNISRNAQELSTSEFECYCNCDALYFATN